MIAVLKKSVNQNHVTVGSEIINTGGSIGFVSVVAENCVILPDINIGQPYTRLLMAIIYEIDPGKVNSHVTCSCASREVGRRALWTFIQATNFNLVISLYQLS